MCAVYLSKSGKCSVYHARYLSKSGKLAVYHVVDI